MLGTAEDEISSNLQEFQGVIKISKKFVVLGNVDFRDFQFWRREPPYTCGATCPRGKHVGCAEQVLTEKTKEKL